MLSELGRSVSFFRNLAGLGQMKMVNNYLFQSIKRITKPAFVDRIDHHYQNRYERNPPPHETEHDIKHLLHSPLIISNYFNSEINHNSLLIPF